MQGGIITGVVMAGSGVTLIARLRGNAGQLVTQASIAAISWQASNLTTGAVAGSGTLMPAQVIYDALQQTDPRWTLDSAAQPGVDGSWGYNFLATLPASTFAPSILAAPPLTPAPASVFRIDVKFTPVSGEPFYVSFQAQAVPVFF